MALITRPQPGRGLRLAVAGAVLLTALTTATATAAPPTPTGVSAPHDPGRAPPPAPPQLPGRRQHPAPHPDPGVPAEAGPLHQVRRAGRGRADRPVRHQQPRGD